MAFEIVDGMTGTKHISSDDLSALNVATIGKADCVLKYGDDFKLTMASANSATIGTGVGMVGGKRFWNPAATSLTIQSGTQGQKRNDLVVARYAKDGSGIESITPVVIKGTPSADTAADPATTANDLKLWRVPLDGINAGTPVRLFEPVTPLATLGESVSQSLGSGSMASDWSDNGCSLSRVGRTVELVVNSIKASSASSGETILTIPTDFAPSVELDFACCAYDESDYPMSAWVAVMPGGRVTVKDYLANGRSGRQIKAVCRYFA